MYCSRCKEYGPVSVKSLDVERFHIQADLSRLNCAICESFIAVIEDGRVFNIDDRFEDVIENGWKKVLTDRERICYYVLSQIIYPEFDTPRADKFESLYDYADEFDDIILRWENGRPIGFYTVKPKGTEIHATGFMYSMPTVDTAYVRGQYRNRGIGLEILSDVITRHPIDDVGFSMPISTGMMRVLERFLTRRKDYRLRFWEIQDGDETSEKLVWFLLRKRKRGNT